jgi:hypothetical protein
MFALFVTMGQSNTTKNGFTRNIPTDKLSVDKEIALIEGDYYIAGYTADQIYLGNIRTPFYLFTADNSLHLQSLQLQFPIGLKYTWQSARISVDSPYIYMSDGITPKFFKGDLLHLKMDTFMSRSSYFTAATNISPGSFAVRAVHATTHENMLLKVQTDSPYVIKPADVLKKQVEGIFCTDGQLKYDKVSNRLIYMYHYRNQYLLLDTNLNLIKTLKTIDTTSTAKISIANTSAQGNFTLATPPAFVNTTLCMQAGRIYINSVLSADNESSSVTDKNNVIDIYAAVNGRYLRSLYISKQHGESLKDMCILKDKLVVLYPDNLVVYNLPKDLLLQ